MISPLIVAINAHELTRRQNLCRDLHAPSYGPFLMGGKLVDFNSAARLRTKSNWNPALMAAATYPALPMS